jgi:uncharacterized protein YlxW (UPF0749 family)
LIVALLIFWLVTVAIFLWLLVWQRASLTELMNQQKRADAEYRQLLRETYETALERERTSSQESLDSEREQHRETLEQQRSLTTEAVKQAAFSTSSTNQSLTDLIKRLIPILAAKDVMAAGQLSTLTDPAGGEAQELRGTPYTAEDDAALESVNAALDQYTEMLREAGITDESIARSTAASVLLPPV